MSLLIRIILCFIFPPLAVADQGCGAFMVVFFLTLLGWVPGTVAALVIAVSKDKK
ncbi:MAG: YqaE/Pmp3 family membrane protein [Lentisphaeria bacterium]|nr:YqaE/Pmp3 family membrane protein [Lentisphaeria bacterium]MDY0176013.1 YqaE/Pmp3 family membrane protein [Lentisphaeria bacterium]